MEIVATLRDRELTLAPIGSLNGATAPELERALADLPDGTRDVRLDCTRMEYASSAGLRVLLAAYKRLGKRHFRVENCNPTVLEVLSITGFAELLGVDAPPFDEEENPHA